MRLALGLFALCSCAEAAPPAALAPPRALPALAVKTILRRAPKGTLAEDSPFVVVLTRPVEPQPHALALVDQAGRSLEGETRWLDRQVVAFYAAAPISGGLDLHLRLVATLRANDGTSLAPVELLALSTPDLEATAFASTQTIDPTTTILIDFPEERRLPAEEIERLGQLSADGAPVAFDAAVVGSVTFITAKAALPPGTKVTFAWKEGAVAATSLGRMHLVEAHATVGQGLRAWIDGSDCRRAHGNDDWQWNCDADLAVLELSAPISDSELARHIHPPPRRASTGDLRGHRLEIPLGPKPLEIRLDAQLQDIFGQPLKAAHTLVIRRVRPTEAKP